MYWFKNSQGSVVVRVKIRSSATGQGLTGLSTASTGMIISTIADNESSATAYTVAGSTIETISTLGTFAAPTATKCRFKEVDPTNHPGLYEIQIADARYAVSNAKGLLISWSGATNMLDGDLRVPLTTVDPYVSGGLLTAAQIATGVWQDTTSGDFTVSSSIGKSLYTSGVVPGGSGGLFIAGTNAATTVTTAFTTTFTGSLTGSVASVSGAVGSVTGAVGSVTGAVGSVTGAVGSVTGNVGGISGITFPTNFSALAITASTGRVDVAKVGGTTQTAGDIYADMATASGLTANGLTLAQVLVDTGTSIPTSITNMMDLLQADEIIVFGSPTQKKWKTQGTATVLLTKNLTDENGANVADTSTVIVGATKP